jgi:parallel beta-helix repeat protein
MSMPGSRSKLNRLLQAFVVSLASLLTVFLLLQANTARAGIINVCYSICAKTTIQSAINAAAPGDTINVSAETYTEHLIITKSLTFVGGWNTSVPAFSFRIPGATIIDGSSNGRVATISGTITVTLDGFTVRHGNAAGSTVAKGYGSGIYIDTANATLVNNKVINNSATITGAFGGGLALINSHVVLSNNLIANNLTSALDKAFAGGGGLYAFGSSLTAISNTFDSNVTLGNGGGIFFDSAGPESPLIRLNLFINNRTTGPTNGGGLLLIVSQSGGLPVVDANRFYSNTSDNGVLGVDVAGVYQVSNNLLLYNKNGGIHTYRSEGGAVANNIVLNTSGVYGGVRLTKFGQQVNLFNNIIMSNSYGLEVQTGGPAPLYAYNLVRSNVYSNYLSVSADGNSTTTLSPGPHDLSSDPQFVDAGNGNYHLKATSPAIDAGGLYGFPGTPQSDFEGNPRPYIGSDSHDCSRPDIGLYEKTPHATAPCNRMSLPLVMKNH